MSLEEGVSALEKDAAAIE
jgi:5'-3' exoribonuclease 1